MGFKNCSRRSFGSSIEYDFVAAQICSVYLNQPIDMPPGSGGILVGLPKAKQQSLQRLADEDAEPSSGARASMPEIPSPRHAVMDADASWGLRPISNTHRHSLGQVHATFNTNIRAGMCAHRSCMLCTLCFGHDEDDVVCQKRCTPHAPATHVCVLGGMLAASARVPHKSGGARTRSHPGTQRLRARYSGVHGTQFGGMLPKDSAPDCMHEPHWVGSTLSWVAAQSIACHIVILT